VLASCGSAARAGPEPELALASSAEAQAQFRGLREQWVSTPLDARVGLERPLTSFVQQHPSDPQGRWARIYLAWLSLQRSKIDLAERWLALAEPGPAGAATDLLLVVRASLELARGHAPEAYQQLLQLQGRLIDADDRLICLDQLIIAAQASGYYREAVSHMLELAAQAARRHRERMWRMLEPRLASIPLSVLEASLPTLSGATVQSAAVRPAERAAAVDWMRRQILDLLARSAIRDQDVELAQRLVATPAAAAADAENSQLLLLATQGGLAPTLLGRSLGLALQLGDPNLTQRSIDVASGISASLGLSATQPGAEQLLLSTRGVEDGGMAAALARLAGDGVSLLVAGLDAQSARLAADFSASRGIPVLLLHEPEPNGQALPASAYVLGADDGAAAEALRRALEPRVDVVISIGSPDAACLGENEAPLSKVGALDSAIQRYGLAFEGDANCARDVLSKLSGKEQRLTIGLGLNALSALNDELASHEIWAVGAGRLPYFDGARELELERWLERKGRTPSWYAALGRDSARLAELAIPKGSPSGLIRDPAVITRVYREVGASLARAPLPELWTSDADRFDAERRLLREFRAVRVSPKEALPR
jgi:hypothetical protein